MVLKLKMSTKLKISTKLKMSTNSSVSVFNTYLDKVLSQQPFKDFVSFDQADEFLPGSKN